MEHERRPNGKVQTGPGVPCKATPQQNLIATLAVIRRVTLILKIMEAI